MKNAIMSLVLVATLGMGTAVAAEQPASQGNNPITQFTGSVWQQTSLDNKKAFLFGLETGIAVEHGVQKVLEQKAPKGKQALMTLSPFEKGWTQAFANMRRDAIVAEIDAWYAAHPEDAQRPVMNVIWYELIAPRLAGKK